MGAKKKKKFPDEPQFGEEQTHTHTAAVCKDMMMIYAVVNQQRNQKKKKKKKFQRRRRSDIWTLSLKNSDILYNARNI